MDQMRQAGSRNDPLAGIRLTTHVLHKGGGRDEDVLTGRVMCMCCWKQQILVIALSLIGSSHICKQDPQECMRKHPVNTSSASRMDQTSASHEVISAVGADMRG